MTLPLFLEIENIRVVHASWVTSDIDKLRKWTSGDLKLTEELLQKSAQKSSEEFNTIENILKGAELKLSEGQQFKDKDENSRDEIRVRWWESAVDRTYKEMAFPKVPDDFVDKPIERDRAANLPVYNDPAPVFFGHYWLDPIGEPRVQADNICCLDYSVAKNGSLAAYCWKGEKSLKNDRIVRV